MTTPATRSRSPPTAASPAPIVLDTFRNAVCRARNSGLHADRQRHGLHHPPRRRQRRTQRLRERAAPPGHHPEELHPEPPHHLRQGRTIPADPETLAHRPTPSPPPSPSCKPCSTPSSTTTTTAARTAPCRTGPPQPPPTRPAPKPAPANRAVDTHDRVRTDRVDQAGTITLRVDGRLHHIGVGRTHARTRVLILVQDLDIRIINAATGELLRELILDPTRRLPTHRRHPKAPHGESPEPNEGSGYSDVLRHHTGSGDRIRTCDLWVMSPASYRAAPPRVG